MTKTILLGLLVLLSTTSILAQETTNSTTEALPISNGVGRSGEFNWLSSEEQIEAANQHDKDYYFRVPKDEADANFRERSPFQGAILGVFPEKSQQAYEDAKEKRETSEHYQPIWEEENQQSLDSNNYYVQPDSNLNIDIEQIFEDYNIE